VVCVLLPWTRWACGLLGGTCKYCVWGRSQWAQNRATIAGRMLRGDQGQDRTRTRTRTCTIISGWGRRVPVDTGPVLQTTRREAKAAKRCPSAASQLAAVFTPRLRKNLKNLNVSLRRGYSAPTPFIYRYSPIQNRGSNVLCLAPPTTGPLPAAATAQRSCDRDAHRWRKVGLFCPLQMLVRVQSPR
jgi:hypothetical protein